MHSDSTSSANQLCVTPAPACTAKWLPNRLTDCCCSCSHTRCMLCDALLAGHSMAVAAQSAHRRCFGIVHQARPPLAIVQLPIDLQHHNQITNQATATMPTAPRATGPRCAALQHLQPPQHWLPQCRLCSSAVQLSSLGARLVSSPAAPALLL